MSDSDEEWMPKKTLKRKSIAPNARRISAAPKIVVSLYSDVDSEQQTKENPKSSKRLSILPKKTSTLKSDLSSDYNVPDRVLSTANSVNRRKSVAPKIVSNCTSESESIFVEKSLKLLPKRKSVAPEPMPNTENEVNPKPSNRRMSVVPKPVSNKCTDELKENEPFQKIKQDTIKSNSERNNFTSSDTFFDNKTNDPTTRKRKSIAPKNASKPLIQYEVKNPPQKRKSATFKGAPSVNPLQDERNKFEEDIKSYSGDDPLSVWYKYFKWVQQNFLKGGKEGQIVPLMQRCLRALDGQKQYYNDKRFIEIWLKFASEAQNPVKVYNHMYNRKIGCEFAKLFIDWSSQLELEGYLVQANEILKKGIDCQAEPIVELKSYWSKFKTRTRPNVVSDSQEPRKPQAKNIQLVTEPKKPKVQEQPMPKDILQKFPCVDDINVNPTSSKQNSGLPNEHFRYYRQSVYMNPRMSVLPTESKIPDGEQEQNDPPVALFEPPDPLKIPMYDKNKIYAWSGEVSFEEIRAADWFKREKTINLELKVSEQASIIAEQAQKIKLLEEKIENFQKFLKMQCNSQQSSTEYPMFNKSQVPESVSVNTTSTISDTNSQHCPFSAYDSSKGHKNAVTETRSSYQDAIIQNNLEGKAVAPASIPKPMTETGNFSCVDPFDSQLNSKFLQSLNLPLDYYGSFYTSKERITLDLKRKDLIRVGDISYLIEDMISEGSYGKVFAAVEQPTNSNASKSKVALKVSKHVSNWEIYMCITLHSRLENFKDLPNVESSVMKVTSAHKYANAIIFTNELSLKGTLLDMVNNYKIKKSQVPELLAMYITWELLQIVSKMHKCKIIHADIKPDNVLIRDNVSTRDLVDSLSLNTALIKLIDFGRAIDLNFFEKGVCFSSTFKKDKCVEMIEKKPWVFQIDWFGLLNCVHVLLFADYIKVKLQANGRWFIEKKLQRRWDQTIWTPLFDELLNIPTCYQEPDIESHCNRIMSKLQLNIKDFKF